MLEELWGGAAFLAVWLAAFLVLVVGMSALAAASYYLVWLASKAPGAPVRWLGCEQSREHWAAVVWVVVLLSLLAAMWTGVLAKVLQLLGA